MLFYLFYLFRLLRPLPLLYLLPLFQKAESYKDAREYLLHHGKDLQRTAEAVLESRGLDYGVQLSLDTESFPDRVYGDLAFPAGEYDALCVRLGRAEGHNWWCVMFPPLCLPAAEKRPDAAFDSSGKAVLGSSPRYDVRFKVVELYQAARRKLS